MVKAGSFSKQIRQDDQVVKQQGQLSSAPTLQQALVPGQPTPTSPFMASQTGASPDAAKMVGTPNQQQNAMREVVNAQDTLRAALEQAQPTKTAEKDASAAELGKFARADEAIAKKAQENLASALGTSAVQLPNATVGVKEDKIKSRLNQTSATYGQDVQQTKDSLALLVNPAATDAEKQSALQKLSGLIGDPNKPFTGYEQLAEYFTMPTPTELMSNLNAENSLSMKVSVSQLSDDDWRSIGFTDSSQAAATLGVASGAFQSMTWDQVKERVQEVRADKFLNAERLTNSANNTLLPPQVRQDARSQLRAMGLVGRRTDEEKLNNLQAQMQDGDKVQLPTGQSVSLSELLTPGPLMDVISKAATDPATLAKLKADPASAPLASWIEKNATGVASLAESIRPQLAAAQATYNTNKNILGDTPSDVVSFLLPDFAKAPGASGPLSNTPAYFENRKQLNDVDKAALDNVIADMAKRDPEEAKRLAGMSLEELRAQNIFGLPTGESGPVQAAKRKEDARTLTGLNLTSDAALRAGSNLAFSGQGNIVSNLAKDSPETLTSILNNLPAEARNLLDADRDGKPDDLATLIRRAGQTPELLDAMRKLPNQLMEARTLSEKQAADAQKVKDDADRKAAKTELMRKQIASSTGLFSGMDSDKLTGVLSKLQPETKQLLDANGDGKVDPVSDILSRIQDSPQLQDALDSLPGQISGAGSKYDTEKFKADTDAAIQKEKQYTSDIGFLNGVSGANLQFVGPEYLKHFSERVKQDPRLEGPWNQYVSQVDKELQRRASQGEASDAELRKYADAGIIPFHYVVSNENVARFKGMKNVLQDVINKNSGKSGKSQAYYELAQIMDRLNNGSTVPIHFGQDQANQIASLMNRLQNGG